MILDSNPVQLDPFILAGFEWNDVIKTYSAIYEEGTGFSVGIYVDVYCDHVNIDLRWHDVRPGCLRESFKLSKGTPLFDMVRSAVLKMSENTMDICCLKH